MLSFLKFKKRAQKNIYELSMEKSLLLKDWFFLFDTFYLCFKEPNRNENWQQIKSLVPGVRKVEGVRGFDKALKVCAKKSRTSHFFLIDGDNQLIDSKLNEPMNFTRLENDWVLSWAALNPLNGLAYGNGGLKLWPKNVALEIKSHENSKGDDQTDYCFIAKYYLIDKYITRTQINSTPQQAFRAGFREGVKMSLAWGKQVDVLGTNFEVFLGSHNRQRLKVWCEVGADMPNGYWAILGARMGLKSNAIERFNPKNINSYEWMDTFLEERVFKGLGLKAENLFCESSLLIPLIDEIGQEINLNIPINLKLMSPAESITFKSSFINPVRSDLLQFEKASHSFV